MKCAFIVSTAVGCLVFAAMLNAQNTNPPPPSSNDAALKRAGVKPIGDWQVDPAETESRRVADRYWQALFVKLNIHRIEAVRPAIAKIRGKRVQGTIGACDR